uniref:Uncharacterized protein n=1 Tax=Cannabis sativa TaxID=3483 RepID=A0A803PR04_CANSA
MPSLSLTYFLQISSNSISNLRRPQISFCRSSRTQIQSSPLHRRSSLTKFLEIECPKKLALPFKTKTRKPQSLLEGNDAKIRDHIIKTNQDEVASPHRKFLQEISEEKGLYGKVRCSLGIQFFPPQRVICDECSGPNTSNSSGIVAWRLKQIKARAVLPLRDYIKEFCNHLEVSPFLLNPISYRILASLKVIYNILGWECPTPLQIVYFYSIKELLTRKRAARGFYYLDTHTNDCRIIVRASHLDSSWDLSPLNPTDIFEIPGSTEFSYYCSPSSSSFDNYDMDLNLENILKSPPLVDNKSKNRAAQVGDASGSIKEPKRTNTKANKKKSSGQLTIKPAKSPEKERWFFSNPPIPCLSRSGQKVRKSAPCTPLMVGIISKSSGLATGSLSREAAQMISLRGGLNSCIREYRDTLAKKWNNSEAEVSRTKEEAEKHCLADQNKIKELEDSIQSIQADHDKKLKELEAETKDRVNSITRRTIYQTWSAKPDMDFSFLGEGVDAMLALCDKTRREELGKDEEVEVEQEDLSKSPKM